MMYVGRMRWLVIAPPNLWKRDTKGRDYPTMAVCIACGTLAEVKIAERILGGEVAVFSFDGKKMFPHFPLTKA